MRGFVRFKNSWGPEWGDNGHALVSVDDLATLLEGASDVLLPIPARGALGAGGRQDVAEEEPAPGGYGPQSIGSDLWTVVDTVGYGAYAEAIARGIQHERDAAAADDRHQGAVGRRQDLADADDPRPAGVAVRQARAPSCAGCTWSAAARRR